MENSEFSPDAIRAELFRRGDLGALLDPNQRAIRAQFNGSTVAVFVIEASRRIGKSFLCCVLAFEKCLQKPRAKVYYASPTIKESKEITLPLMREIVAALPDDIRPEYLVHDSKWIFKNGSEVTLFGADDESAASKGRGTGSDLSIVDEGGFSPVLKYLVDDVLLPQTMLTKGKTLLCSTPPLSPGHDFCRYADQAFIKGAYVTKTIYDNPRLTRAEADQFLSTLAEFEGIELEAFKKTATCRREYFAERVIEDTLAIVPEFAQVKDEIVAAHPRAPFFDLYLSLDPGMSDKTGVLFGVTDFRNNILTIEHELLLTGANTLVIAEEIRNVLATYPTTINGQGQVQGIVPYSAVMDGTVPFVDRDLYQHHKLTFALADKRDSEAGINLMRMVIAGKQLRIHPRCVNLIRQLSNAIRNKQGGDMARTARDGHFDLVAALKYMVRDWTNRKQHNPYPKDWSFDQGGLFDHTKYFRREEPKKKTLADVILKGTSLAAKKRRF